jgi:hypothetical protein
MQKLEIRLEYIRPLHMVTGSYFAFSLFSHREHERSESAPRKRRTRPFWGYLAKGSFEEMDEQQVYGQRRRTITTWREDVVC